MARPGAPGGRKRAEGTRSDTREEEIERLKAKVGEIAMAKKLPYAKIDMLEGGRPLAVRRLRK